MTFKVAVLFSGGKDSSYATWIVQHQGWDIAALVTVRSRAVDSLMFHYPNVEWAHLQAEAMGLPHVALDITDDDEVADLKRALGSMKIQREISGVVTGAVASDYQKTRFDNMCNFLGLKSYSPLWHKDPKLLVGDFKKAGFRIVLTGVAAKGLGPTWLGRELSDAVWSEFEGVSTKHGIHLAGEGGEYESFVLDAPHFKKAVVIEESRIDWDGQRGTMLIEEASLRDKLGN